MSGYVEVCAYESGMTVSYYVGRGSFDLSRPASVWIVPGTAK